MTKEKIKELLLSRDKELRLLGLSYLNEDKNSPKLCSTFAENWPCACEFYYTPSLPINGQSLTMTFKDIYDFIIYRNYAMVSDNFLADTFSKILTPYINYCYK